MDLTCWIRSRSRPLQLGRFVLSSFLIVFLIQVIVFFAGVFVLVLLPNVFGVVLPLYAFLVFQSLISAFTTFKMGLEWWWCIIQIIFPVAIVFGVYVGISRWLSFSFLILLFLIFGSVVSSRVPYYPSSKRATDALTDLFRDEKRARRFVDIGSGFGGVLSDVSRVCPHWSVLGVEAAIVPWLVSYIRSQISLRSNFSVQFRDYELLNFGDFDIVFAYLSPVVMERLWNKVKCEMKPGAMFLSYEFEVVDVFPSFVIDIDNGKKIYIWQF